MIVSKEGVSRRTLIELMQYSFDEECQFLSAVKPQSNIVNDHVFQLESVITFLRIEEKVYEDIDGAGNKTYRLAFSVKILVEDRYWVLGEGEQQGSRFKSGKVPTVVVNRVTQILNPDS